MRLDVHVDGDLSASLEAEIAAAERAVTVGVTRTGEALKVGLARAGDRRRPRPAAGERDPRQPLPAIGGVDLRGVAGLQPRRGDHRRLRPRTC